MEIVYTYLSELINWSGLTLFTFKYILCVSLEMLSGIQQQNPTHTILNGGLIHLPRQLGCQSHLEGEEKIADRIVVRKRDIVPILQQPTLKSVFM